MIRYPFESKDGRVKKYLIVSMLLAIIPAMFVIIGSNLIGADRKEFELRRVGYGFAFFFRVIFLIVFIFSIAYTWKKLRGPGFSKEVRSLIL